MEWLEIILIAIGILVLIPIIAIVFKTYQYIQIFKGSSCIDRAIINQYTSREQQWR